MSIPPTASRPALRPGQARALERWADSLRGGSRSELVVVPVGYGKTIIGVGSFEVAVGLAGADTCLYLTPTDVLRSQVFAGVDKAVGVLGSARPIRKILAENRTAIRIAESGANFVVATYQQVASRPDIYRRLCERRRVHIVADEAHHLGESGRWATALGGLAAVSKLLLSATPVRLDRDALADVRYLEEPGVGLVIDPLVAVSMRQAWQEGRILKYLHMQMKDYAVRIQDAAGDVKEFTASDMADLPDFDQRLVRRELRWMGDYVEPLVQEFASTLEQKLRISPGQHQGLVFAATTEHANHLAEVFAEWHPGLRVTVVHTGDIGDTEAARRMVAFHEGRHDVLIQVKKASEGFDAPRVSVLLKLDAVHSREPVVQQLGRGLRYNHEIPDGENLLNVFIGRDPRLAPIVESLERDATVAAVKPASSVRAEELDRDDEPGRELDPGQAVEILDVVEAGDSYVDHTGMFIEGQQLGLFGDERPAPPPRAAPPAVPPEAEVVDLQAELDGATAFCRTWTNRAARQRAALYGPDQNHYAALNLAYTRATGRRGTLRTAEEYRHKGEWMKQRYADFLR